MPERAEAILEAERRGLLSPDQAAALAEARKRGLFDGKPQSLAELTGGLVTRPAFEATGGIIGGIVGAGAGGVAGVAGGPAAPATVPGGAVGGGLIGGGLGSAAGSLTFDSIEDLLRFSGVIESPSPTVGERSALALRSGVEDIAFAGGAQVVGKGLGALKPGLGRILGLRGQAVDEVVNAAAAAEIPVGAVDVGSGTGSRILRGTAKVLGIFPWIGGPFRKNAAIKADAVTSRVNELLDGMAPNATLSNELGIDMADAARGSIREFRETSARLYDNFERLAKDAGEIVPTNVPLENGDDVIPSIRDVAASMTAKRADGQIAVAPSRDAIAAHRQASKEFDARMAQLDLAELKANRLKDPEIKEQTLETIRLQRRAVIGREPELTDEVVEGPLGNEFANFVENLARLPEHITIQQYRQVADDLSDFIGSASAKGVNVARFAELKQSMEAALVSIDPSSASNGQAIVDALQTANAFYSKGITQFQTPTGQKFGRVETNIFRPGPVRPGTLNEDEIARAAVNLKSPQAIEDLRKLVGDDLIGQAARRHFETAWQNSVVIDQGGDIVGFNWQKFSKDVGLSGKGETSESLRAFLKNSDTDLSTLKAVIDTASKIEIPRSVSTFIARRAALGGFSSAFAGATAAGIVKDSLLGSVAVTLLLRNFTSIISDPAQLRAMRRSLSPDISVAQKRALIGRLLENLGDPADTSFEDKQIDREIGEIQASTIASPTIPIPRGP